MTTERYSITDENGVLLSTGLDWHDAIDLALDVASDKDLTLTINEVLGPDVAIVLPTGEVDYLPEPAERVALDGF
jgi:hypothetical protein